MQLQTLDPPDDIAFFIVEGMHRLATISMNDYGFVLSVRMAQTCLGRASQMLDTKGGFDREFITDVSTLKTTAVSMRCEYVQFEVFCADCDWFDRFDRLKTPNWREWLSKCAVCAISRSYRGTVSHHLARKTRLFHSRLCAMLTQA